MQRRDFLKVLATGSAIAVYPSMVGGKLYAEDGTLFTSYGKVQLVDEEGNPLLASKLEKEKNYVFNYPHVATTCILVAMNTPAEKKIALKDEDGVEYIWNGAVGKENNIVAYSAICPHQLTHINKEDTFISYLAEGGKTMACKESGVIVCGSHLSAYDPHKGCKVMAGPAPQPLASIVLEHHDDDTIWAVAVLGNDKFHQFFSAFKPELKEQFGGKRKAKKKVKESATTMALNDYTKDVIRY